MDINGQIRAPTALSLWEDIHFLILVGPRAVVNVLTEKYLPQLGIEPRLSNPQAVAD
jgi:hypothetical protein